MSDADAPPEDAPQRLPLFRRRFATPGAKPGYFAGDSRPGSTAVRVLDFSLDQLDERDVPAGELLGPVPPGQARWIDVDGVQDHERLHELFDELDIHDLVAADIANVGQRPKVEEHDAFAFLVLRMVVRAEGDGVGSGGGGGGGGGWRWEQFSLVVGDRWVASFNELPGDCLDGVRSRLRKGKPIVRGGGASMLAAMLADAVIDGYFPLLENLSDRLEDLEDRVVQDPSKDVLADVYAMKRELLLFRRAAWPIRELMTTLSRDGSERFDTATMPYLRDAADHATQIVEVLESYRELAAGFVDVYLSSVANRTNEVMRVLTILATIFIPLTFIAGIYGMNFDDIPELHWRHGYAFFWVTCAVVTLGLLATFRRLGWITLGRRRG